MTNDEVSRGIIVALLKLANSSQFKCDLDGARTITEVATGATNHIAVLAAAIEAATEADEVIDNE